jgi:hypothetical protein
LFEGYCPLNSTTAMAEKFFMASFPLEDFCIVECELSDTHWKWCGFEVNISLVFLLLFGPPELWSVLRTESVLSENCYHFHPLTFVNCECGFLWRITKTLFRNKHTEADLRLQLLLIVLHLKYLHLNSLHPTHQMLTYSKLCCFVGGLTCGGVSVLFYLLRSTKSNPTLLCFSFPFAHYPLPVKKFEKRGCVGL